jgi:hypothetical protein
MLTAELNFEFRKFEDKGEVRNSELTEPKFSIAPFSIVFIIRQFPLHFSIQHSAFTIYL